MRERPILFSGPMVRAILGGRKTQTRRVIKPLPRLLRVDEPPEVAERTEHWTIPNTLGGQWCCPDGVPGDRLWVREPWTADFGATFSDHPDAWWHEMPRSLRTQKAVGMIWYAADGSVYHPPNRGSAGFSSEVRRSSWEPTDDDRERLRWQSSRFMPRWASRLTLEITGVRVERVQEIGAADLEAEGMCLDEWGKETITNLAAMKAGFRTVWDSLNATRGHGWDVNPWVWVIEFRRADA